MRAGKFFFAVIVLTTALAADCNAVRIEDPDDADDVCDPGPDNTVECHWHPDGGVTCRCGIVPR